MTRAEINRKVQAILKLCIDVTDNTKADCFFKYSGHVKTMEIDIHYEGWSREKPSYDEQHSVKLDWEFEYVQDDSGKTREVSIEEQLEKMIQKLKDLRKKK